MFNFFKRKVSKTRFDESTLEKISKIDITLIQEAEETISVAAEVVQSLKSKIDDYDIQMQKISSMINDAVIMTNCNGIIENINKSAENIFGYENIDLKGLPFSILLEESITNISYIDDIAQQCEKEIQYHKECKGIKKDKSIIYIEISVSKIKKTNNKIYYIIIIKDVTTRVINEIQLKESEQYFRSFGEASTEAMMLHNDNKILKYNDKLSELTNYSSIEIEDINPYSIFQEKDLPYIHTTEFNDKEIINTYIRTKTGEYIPISLTNKNVNWNEEEAKIKVIKDITVYKKIEDILRSNGERYRSVIDNNIDIVCCYDINLTITFVNQTFLDYYCLESNDVIGKTLEIFFSKDDYDMLQKNVNQISITNPVKRSLYRIPSNDDFRWQDWIDRGIFNDNGELIEIQAVARDVTAYIKIK